MKKGYRCESAPVSFCLEFRKNLYLHNGVIAPNVSLEVSWFRRFQHFFFREHMLSLYFKEDAYDKERDLRAR